MPPMERDVPGDRHLRHSHSASSGALIPMWDSSDPERAPPPLPLNPQSPSVATSRSGTSLAIQSAHAALTEKARESTLVPHHLTKRGTDPSPERALVPRPSPHKRMQSLQQGTVRDMSLMIEGSRDISNFSLGRASPEKERFRRPSTPSHSTTDYSREPKSPEKENTAPSTPTLMPSGFAPAIRPPMRRSQQSILGENTPPQSATMLALQNMAPPSTRAESEPPLNNVTNNSMASRSVLHHNDPLSEQLMTLTNIASSLQKEMSQLSRRSRDNATDLMSLKEATHARDEDIRKSLRDLVHNVDTTRHHKDTFTGGLYLDNKPFNSSTTSKAGRPISLPRIPSPGSFAASIDRESSIGTPSLVGGATETPATMALLEKIIREMGTKDGQESMISHLSELAEKMAGMASATKVEELIDHLKTANQELSMIPAGTSRTRNSSFDDNDSGVRELDWSHRNGVVAHRVEKLFQEKDGSTASAPSGPAQEVLTEEIMKIIRSVKDSVGQAGGMTAEVKALVRELRGEVLGMGREIGRKLEEKSANGHHSHKSEASRAELARIVEEGLEQMKVYMQQRLREHRRESTESTKDTIDYQEIYSAVRTAISDTQANKSKEPELRRDDVMEAVRVAWERYEPKIQVEPIGLEREEVLACIREGIEEHVPNLDVPQGASKDEVYQAVHEGLKHFAPPPVEAPPAISRDEILDAVRECLEEFEFPVAPSAIGQELSRNDLLDAVREGLNTFEFPDSSRALVPHGGDNTEVLDRLHDIMQYMRAEFQAISIPRGSDNSEVLDRLQDIMQHIQVESNALSVPQDGDNSKVVERLESIMQYMQDEFRAVSEEAKQNVAANGRDTEQVLDATKDGFETLRVHMEGYINTVSGATNQEETLANIVNSLDNFRGELAELVAKSSDDSRNILRQEVESLRDAVNSSLVPHVPPPSDNKEALDTIREGIERIRSELLRPHAGTTDILDALHEGFSDVKTSIDRMDNKPVDLTANDEILDALKSGLGGVRDDLDTLRETSQNERAVAAVGAIPSDAMILADLVKHDDIKNLEVMMTQLRIKMEAMEPTQPGTVGEEGLSRADLAEMEEMLRNGASKDDLNQIEEIIRNGVSKDDLNQVEEIIRNLQESIAGMSAGKDPEAPINLEDGATKEDVQAIETILRNTKARLDDMIDGEQAVRKDHIDALEALVLETKDSLGSVTTQFETVTRKEDLVGIESLVTQVTAALDEMKERAEKSLEDPEKVTKTDIDAIEAAVIDVKSVVEQMAKSDDFAAHFATLPSKDDVKDVEGIVKSLKDHYEDQLKTNAKAIEDRSASIAAVGDQVTEAKTCLDANLNGVGDRITEVKTFLQEFQDMAQEKLDAGATGVDSLAKVLDSLSETIGANATVGSDLKEMFETMKTEFEDSKNGVVGAKLDTDEKLKETTEALSTKIDEKIGELVTKYEEFQLVTEDRTKAGEARDEEIDATMMGTKAIAEELKVLIDTLGSTVTDSLEKMEEASKTVFEKVEIMYSKAEDNHADGKNEHQLTRDQVKEAIGVVEGLQGNVTEYQPQILEAVKDILLIVGQHYEHSKNSTTDLQRKIEDAVKEEPPMLPPPVEKYDDTEVHTKLDKLDKFDGEMHLKLDKLDSEVHSKLDQLVCHNESADKAYAQLDTLEKVHQQVVQTAAEISELLATQRKSIEEEREDHEKTLEDQAKALQETNIALERQRTEKEHVEANLAYLRDEEAQLRESVLALRAEQESLSRQNKKANAEVSSLETALRLRHEELQVMDARVEGMERRILEGVLDNSRAFLMTKSANKGRDAMSRKRVPAARTTSGTDAGVTSTTPQKPTPKKRTGANLAVAGNRVSLVVPAPNNNNRRILSLSQIPNNVPTGGLKRSQSVRNVVSGPRSWGSPASSGAARKGYGDLDKENNVALVRESDEDEAAAAAVPELEIPGAGEPSTPVDEEGPRTPSTDDTPTPVPAPASEISGSATGDEESESDAGTLRRDSLGTTVITATESAVSGSSSGYTDGYDENEDDDDEGEDEEESSQWTGSHVDGDSLISESIADTDSIAGEGEVVVYAA
ncbi:hypothetical protein F4780DRAFT_232985 [Xylariomycetidae sp. FL0641]|nr:hypothetical protein F4780DRAFT_232985 [Xylariomycetidae sp. FL0641]